MVLLGLAGSLFSGCSTDLDPNADYKEIMVIYSVLDPDQTVHYAKVNKAFVNTNSNALNIAANNPDSLQYGDEVKVVLQKLTINNNDTTVKNGDEYPMERFIATGKEPGAFYSGEQVLYRTLGSVKLADDAAYRIKAVNTKTGVEASGATQIVQDVPSNPRTGLCIYTVSRDFGKSGQCFSLTQPFNFSPFEKGNMIIFHQAPNAKIYVAKMKFKFTETTDGVTEEKEVEWYVRNNFIQESAADPNIALEDNFFQTNLLALIDRSNDNSTTTRVAGDVFVTVTGGSTSLEAYYRINNSFSLISQTRPEYDNIKGGTGLVASRRTKVARGFLTTNANKTLATYQELKFQP